MILSDEWRVILPEMTTSSSVNDYIRFEFIMRVVKVIQYHLFNSFLATKLLETEQN